MSSSKQQAVQHATLQRTARLCSELDQDLEGIAAEICADELLEEIITDIRDGRDPGPLWELLDEELRKAGIAGGLGTYPDRQYRPLPGIARRSSEEILTCPEERCTRIERPGDGTADDTVCTILNRPMRRLRLQP